MNKDKPTAKVVRSAGNLAFAQAMHGKHSLTHQDRRTRRARTRATAQRRALEDSR